MHTAEPSIPKPVPLRGKWLIQISKDKSPGTDQIFS